MNFFNPKRPPKFLTIAIVTVVVYVVVATIASFSTTNSYTNISDFMKMNQKAEVKSVKMYAEILVADLHNGETVIVSYPMFYSVRLIDSLMENGVTVDFLGNKQSGGAKFFGFIGSIISWLPIILMTLLSFGIFKGMGGKGNSGGSGGGIFGGPLQFGKNKAKMISPKDLKVTFNDVAGIDEEKKDVAEIVDFLKNPNKYRKIGGIIPKGCLLIGYPGTGKTLLAKAIASEAGVPFFFISGSDFVEMFVGVGASRVRDMFANAKKHAPCIIFIDEIDAVGRHRGAGIGGGNDEREQTLNQLLVEMDGFEENNGVIVLAATNRPDVLDSALLRPGRFDRQITISMPDISGREAIFNVHLKKIKTSPSVDSRVLARGTPGFSGADIANLVNESALLAARDSKEIVTMQDLEEAKDKILMGNARNTGMKKEEKELTAYHEGSHALVSVKLNICDPIHKVTVIPRGRSLGVTVRLPESDVVSVTFEKLKADLAVAMAGRVGEEIIFGKEKITTGASSDIKKATSMARSMVLEYGFSDKIGKCFFANDERDSFSSNRSDFKYSCSQDTAKTADEEIIRFVDEAYETARSIILSNMDQLHLIAKTLLEFETITGDELNNLLENGVMSKSSTGVETGKSSFHNMSVNNSSVDNSNNIEKDFESK